MSNVLLNRLSYIKNYRSWRQIANQTGIPYRRLLRIRNAAPLFKGDEKRLIRNLYQRTTYGQLRLAGYSPRESTRWSWQNPFTVKKNISALEDKIAKLAYGKTYEQFTFEERTIGSKEFKDRLAVVYEAIREGIRKSPEKTEIWFEY